LISRASEGRHIAG
ncbi:unnamed protein product, partial [Allacma fusca]